MFFPLKSKFDSHVCELLVDQDKDGFVLTTFVNEETNAIHGISQMELRRLALLLLDISTGSLSVKKDPTENYSTEDLDS